MKRTISRPTTRRRRAIGGSVAAKSTPSAPALSSADVAKRRADTTLSLNNPALASIKPEIDALAHAATDAVSSTVNRVATGVVDRGASLAAKGVTRGAAAVGLNVSDSLAAKSQLADFAGIVGSEEAQAAAIDIGKSVGKIGLTIASELMPLAEPVISEGISVAEEGAKKAVDSAVNAGKYAVSSVLGPFATVPFAVASVVDAAVSVADTGSKLTTTVSDTVNAAIDISDKIFKEQQETMDRISQTTDAFLAHRATSAAAANRVATALTPSSTYAAKARAAQRGGGASSSRTKSCLRRHSAHPKKHSIPSTPGQGQGGGARHQPIAPANYTRKRVRFNKIIESNSVFI